MLYPIELRAPVRNTLKSGRGGEIRTPDILVPNQARYQATLHPEPAIIPVGGPKIKSLNDICARRRGKAERVRCKMGRFVELGEANDDDVAEAVLQLHARKR